MLKRASLISFILFFILLVIFSFKLIQSTLVNQNIQKTIAKISPSDKKENTTATEQIRKDVIKDMWMVGEKQRLHYHLESEYSTLSIFPKGYSYELVEQMQGITCYLQEKIEKEKDSGNVFQEIRFIQSDEGRYSYDTHRFYAEKVFLAIFNLPGDELMLPLPFNQAFVQGEAEKVRLHLLRHYPDFHAAKFKAKINPKESIR